jgi:hypothetical protein
MQFQGKQALGVVYNTTMSRPDAALALAMLYGFTGKREARPGAICVNGSGLGAAIYCDILARFYTPGPPRNANQALPTGLDATDPLPPDPPMVKVALAQDYPRTITKLSDTSVAEAVLRNGVIFNAEAVMILSAPATCLARTLNLQGVKDLYKQRVKMLVIVDAVDQQDPSALSRILSDWPTPIVHVPRELGEVLQYPATSIEKDFSWTAKHPVADACRAFQPMPYNAPAWDMVAMLHAVHPDQGFFESEPVKGSTNRTTLKLDPAKKDKILQAFIELASAQPPKPQPPRQRPPA